MDTSPKNILSNQITENSINCINIIINNNKQPYDDNAFQSELSRHNIPLFRKKKKKNKESKRKVLTKVIEKFSLQNKMLQVYFAQQFQGVQRIFIYIFI